MSTLIVENISDGTISATASQIAAGVTKTHVHFKGDGVVSIYNSLNVSSVVDAGVGLYDVYMNTGFSSTNYTIVGMASQRTATVFPGAAEDTGHCSAVPLTTSVYDLVTVDNDSNSKNDFVHVTLVAFGN